MKIILHIGAHKTGSSSIQACLNKSTEELHKLGWDYIPASGLVGADLSKRTGDEVPYACQVNELVSRVASNKHNKIISGENFFFLHDLSQIKSLYGGLSQLSDDITIIVYLRNQIKMALSNKAQGAKTLQSALIFGNDSENPLPSLNNNVIKYLDYYEKLKLWKEGFPNTKFIVRKFEKEDLVNEDSVSDFISVLGLKIKPKKDFNANVSLGSVLTNFFHKLSSEGLKPKFIYRIFRKKVFEDVGGIKQLPSKEEVIHFMKPFIDSNSKIEQEFNISLGASVEDFPDERQVQEVDEKYIYQNMASVLNNIMEENEILKKRNKRLRAFIKNEKGD